MAQGKEFYRIDPNATVTKVIITDYKDAQREVGGYITTAPITRAGGIPVNTTAYANDEGTLMGLRFNMVASFTCGYELYGPVLVRATKKVTEWLVAQKLLDKTEG